LHAIHAYSPLPLAAPDAYGVLSGDIVATPEEEAQAKAARAFEHTLRKVKIPTKYN
jgi:hypothetical protein